MKFPPGVPRQIATAIFLCVAIALWLFCLWLLVEVARQMVDVMRFMIELTQMG